MNAQKLVVLACWVFGLGSFFVATGTTAAWVGRILFAFLFVVHALECVVMLPRFRAAGGGLGGHVAQTMLYGFLHWKDLPKPRASAG